MLWHVYKLDEDTVSPQLPEFSGDRLQVQYTGNDTSILCSGTVGSYSMHTMVSAHVNCYVNEVIQLTCQPITLITGDIWAYIYIVK